MKKCIQLSNLYNQFIMFKHLVCCLEFVSHVTVNLEKKQKPKGCIAPTRTIPFQGSYVTFSFLLLFQ